jgi:DNA-binding transcriptional LysR family regulator
VLVVQSRQAPVATKSVTIADLAEHRVGAESRRVVAIEPHCSARWRASGKQVRLGIDMHGTETQLQLVAAGLGLGLAPTRLLANSRYLKDLRPVEVSDFALKIDLWLLRAPELGNLNRALEVLGQVLVRTFEIGRPSKGGRGGRTERPRRAGKAALARGQRV